MKSNMEFDLSLACWLGKEEGSGTFSFDRKEPLNEVKLKQFT